jgi:hypothetical protein
MGLETIRNPLFLLICMKKFFRFFQAIFVPETSELQVITPLEV